MPVPSLLNLVKENPKQLIFFVFDCFSTLSVKRLDVAHCFSIPVLILIPFNRY